MANDGVSSSRGPSAGVNLHQASDQINGGGGTPVPTQSDGPASQGILPNSQQGAGRLSAHLQKKWADSNVLYKQVYKRSPDSSANGIAFESVHGGTEQWEGKRAKEFFSDTLKTEDKTLKERSGAPAWTDGDAHNFETKLTQLEKEAHSLSEKNPTFKANFDKPAFDKKIAGLREKNEELKLAQKKLDAEKEKLSALDRETSTLQASSKKPDPQGNSIEAHEARQNEMLLQQQRLSDLSQARDLSLQMIKQIEATTAQLIASLQAGIEEASKIIKKGNDMAAAAL